MMRARSGSNDNPYVVHYHVAQRKLLANASILISNKSNCLHFEIENKPLTDVMFISPRRARSHWPKEEEIEYVASEEAEMFCRKLDASIESSRTHLADELKCNTINFIAKTAEKKIANPGNCGDVILFLNNAIKFHMHSKTLNHVSVNMIHVKRRTIFLYLQLLKSDIHFETIRRSFSNNIIVLDNMYKE